MYTSGVHPTGVYLMGVPHRRTSQAYTSFTSLLCTQDTGGGNPRIDTIEASDYGRLGHQAADHP
jgi:hypothetical protein